MITCCRWERCSPGRQRKFNSASFAGSYYCGWSKSWSKQLDCSYLQR